MTVREEGVSEECWGSLRSGTPEAAENAEGCNRGLNSMFLNGDTKGQE